MRGFDREAFIGTKWGKDGQLTVLRISPYEKYKPAIDVWLHCSECAKDPELFGDAIFMTQRSGLLKGNIPCGCGVSHRWTEAQYRIKLQRFCKEKNCELINVGAGQNKTIDINSRITLKCNIDGNVWHTGLGHVMRGKGCGVCYHRNRVVPEAEAIANFRATGRYHAGAEFRRTSVSERLWDYYCPTCAKDEFAKAGLCNGIFSTRASALEKGCVPCRCADYVSLTKEQCEYKIRQACSGQVEFVAWKDGTKIGLSGNTSRFFIDCPVHGIQETCYIQLCTTDVRCKKCKTGGGYRRHLPGYLYVLKVRGEGCKDSFTGYGITNHTARRMSTHSKNFREKQRIVEESEVFALDGNAAADLEAVVKAEFPVHSQPISGFKREATFAHLYEDVVAFIKKLLPQPAEPLLSFA